MSDSSAERLPERLYVYGLIRPDIDMEIATGAVERPDAAVRTIAIGPMSALVSDIGPDEVMSTRRNLLAHARALEAAMAQATVLPVRFGVIAETIEDLARAVAPQADRLLGLIERMDSKAEFGVRVTWDREAIMREIVEEAPHLAQRQAELATQAEAASYYARIDLGREVAERLSHKRTQEEARLFAILRRAASDAKLQGPDDDVQVLKADFLLTAGQEREITQLIEEIEGEAPGRLNVRIVGPAPTYNFVNVRLELDQPPAARAAA